MSGSDVYHCENGDQSFGNLCGQNKEHRICDQGTDKLMNPLDPDSKLEQECTKNKRKEMFHFSVGECKHNHTEWVADEHSKQVFQSLHILSSSLREILYSFFDKAGNYNLTIEASSMQ